MTHISPYTLVDEWCQFALYNDVICDFKGKPGFLVENKLPSIFSSNSHQVQQTSSFLHGTLKTWGHHINFCMTTNLNQ